MNRSILPWSRDTRRSRWSSLRFLPVGLALGELAFSADLPPAARTQIRIATSTDGLNFDDESIVLFDRASAPSVLTLENGELLAVFDRATGESALDTTLMSSRSRDAGKSWSRPRSVRISGINPEHWHVRHAALIRSTDAPIRAIFAAEQVRNVRGRESRSARIGAGGGVLILSAISQDGTEFRLDPRTRLRLDRIADAHPTAVWIERELHVYAAMEGAGVAGRSVAAHYLSQNGHTFGRVADVTAPASFLGDVRAHNRGMIALLSTDEGIVSVLSRDGRNWRREGGRRVPDGWDPSVARLADESFILLYCARSTATSGTVEAVLMTDAAADADSEYDRDIDDSIVADSEIPPGGVILLDHDDAEDATHRADTAPDAAIAVNANAEAKGTGAHPDGRPVQSVDESMRDVSATERERRDRAGYDEPPALAMWEHVDPNGFAPRPDFRRKTDYLEWYRRFGLPNPPDNSYYAYAAFMPMSADETKNPPWPEEFKSIYDGDREAPPGPWNPADHPEWEATNQEWKPLIDSFRDAVKHAGYATPPDKLEVSTADMPDDEKLLLGILLPSLASHRMLAKATIADAWRTEDGKIDPKRMIDAMRNVLRGANHLSQGTTLIEDLVAAAERRLVHETAAQALANDVFSGDNLLNALDALMENDYDDRDPADLIKGEHAFSMDIIQYMFSPPSPDGSPQINLKRAEAVVTIPGNNTVKVSDLVGMGPRDAYAAIDAFDAHYREFAELVRVGYPAVRAADIETLTEARLNTNPITRMFMPSLSRYYKLKSRSETSRRATQLVYATHIFKARTGRWPDSLSELSPATVPGLSYHSIERMRIDPFTGGYFGYRLDENGPRIWSASENALDDRGVHAPRWDDEPDPATGSDDHLFWPVQQ